MTREHLPFITLWHNQMDKVIPADTTGVYAKDSIGYSMTDESTLNSLFAFSSQAPETAEYLLDKDPDAYLAHFGLKPKPWQHFTAQSLGYYDEIQKILQWGKAQGIILPPLPPSFLLGNKLNETLKAVVISNFRQIRYQLSTRARLLIRKWKKA
jgi:lipopolysaccharide biosynthesis glycosyltransferase